MIFRNGGFRREYAKQCALKGHYSEYFSVMIHGETSECVIMGGSLKWHHSFIRIIGAPNLGKISGSEILLQIILPVKGLDEETSLGKRLKR